MKFTPNFARAASIGGLSAVAAIFLSIGMKYSPWGNMGVALQSPIQTLNQMLVPTPETLFGKSRVEVLLVGLDYDYDNLDQETSKASRSDIIMALDLDAKNHHISELSIPRDMIATLPNGQLAKINQAQSDGGIAESEAVVAKWLGIAPFDRHIVLRIDTAKDLINAVGGIDVNVQNADALRGQGANGPINYDDNWGHLHIHLKPGMQHLDGERAVGYARFRHDWCSDPCRILRQQQIIHALVDKVEHNQLNTLTHLQGIIDVVKHDVDTNLKPQEELALAVSFSHIALSDIHTAQVPYVDTEMLPDYGDSLIPDEKAKRRLVASFFASPDASEQRMIRVCIENGTTVPGLAARIGGQLRAKGFTISELRDAPRSDISTTEIHGASADGKASLRVKEALGESASSANILSNAVTDDSTESSADVTVVLGKDIIGSGQ